MSIKGKIILGLLGACILVGGCNKQDTVLKADIASVNIPNLQLYQSGVYYGADKLSDTDIETLDVKIEYTNGTVVEKQAYIVYQSGQTADYEYVDVSDTEGKIVITEPD